jgi:hypothetical protein
MDWMLPQRMHLLTRPFRRLKRWKFIARHAVQTEGLSVYGVSYVDVTDSEAIITAARAARMVAVSSPQLLELLRRYGIHDVHVMAPAGAPEGGAAARTMIRVPSRRRQP